MTAIDAAGVAKALSSCGIAPLPHEALESLATHLRVLLEWNRRTNLTAIRKPADALRLHVAESLFGLPLLPACRPGVRLRLVDLGSGNGYPALPLLIGRSDIEAVLVESSEKKAAFLRSVIRTIGLASRASVLVRRVARARDLPDQWDVLTLRAFPDPRQWVGEAVRSPTGHSVLAWLSAGDALGIARDLQDETHGIETTDLATREGCMILKIIKTK